MSRPRCIKFTAWIISVSLCASLLSGCNIEDDAKELAITSTEYGWACHDRGHSQVECKSQMQKILHMPQDNKRYIHVEAP